MKQLCLSFLLFSSIFHINGANEAIKDSISLNEVVVTGTQTQVSRSNVPMTVSVVSRQQLEESSKSNILPVLSQRIPGLFVSERGMAGFGVATGSAGAITIRGVGSTSGGPTDGGAKDPLVNTQVLFLIDGHPQFMGLMGHHLSDAYLSANVERVEVVRGPASVLYGSNAMGGVVNIITRTQKQDGFHGSAEVAYGSYNTQRYSTHGAYKSGGLESFLSLTHEQTDGHRPNSQYNNNSGYAKVGYHFSDHFSLIGDLGLTKFKAYDPGANNVNSDPNSWVDVLRGSSSLSFTNQFEKTGGAWRLYWNFGDHDVNATKFHSQDHMSGVSFYQNYRFFKGNNVTFGVDYQKYGGSAENIANPNSPVSLVDKEINDVASYLTIQQNLFQNKLTLNGGLRYDKNSVYGGEWIPQAGLAYRPVSGTVFKSSVAKGFRNPTIKELYMFPPHNETLRPERMINYEVSWLQSWAGGAISTELTAFTADGSNLIKLSPVGGVPKYFNTGAFHHKGIEAVLDYQITKQLDFSANYSFLDMKTPVLAAPKHQLYANLGYSPIKKLSFHLGTQYVGKLYLSTVPNNLVATSYTLVDVQTAFRPNKHLELNLSVNNLLNEQYQNLIYYPMPGANVMGGVKVRF